MGCQETWKLGSQSARATEWQQRGSTGAQSEADDPRMHAVDERAAGPERIPMVNDADSPRKTQACSLGRRETMGESPVDGGNTGNGQ